MQRDKIVKGKVVQIKNSDNLNGRLFKIEGFWSKITNGLIWGETCNKATIQYAQRAMKNKLPMEDDPVYGTVDRLEILVHPSELEDPEEVEIISEAPKE